MGAHLNHEFFFESLSPLDEKGGLLPKSNSQLSNMINSNFGDMASFKKHFINKTMNIEGDGYGWLVYNKNASILEY